MDWFTAYVIANGQPLSLFGDNLFFDVDFSDVLPGAICAVGDSILEITIELGSCRLKHGA